MPGIKVDSKESRTVPTTISSSHKHQVTPSMWQDLSLKGRDLVSSMTCPILLLITSFLSLLSTSLKLAKVVTHLGPGREQLGPPLVAALYWPPPSGPGVPSHRPSGHLPPTPATPCPVLGTGHIDPMSTTAFPSWKSSWQHSTSDLSSLEILLFKCFPYLVEKKIRVGKSKWLKKFLPESTLLPHFFAHPLHPPHTAYTVLSFFKVFLLYFYLCNSYSSLQIKYKITFSHKCSRKKFCP